MASPVSPHLLHSLFSALPSAKWSDFSFLPTRASSYATQLDLFVLFMLTISGVISLGIAFFIIYFGLRYRKGTRVNRHMEHGPQAARRHLWIEIIWSVIPLGIVMLMFVWGAVLYYNVKTPPKGAMDIAVTGKQWMWKFQHPDGRREIDVLHVPVGQAVKLTMTSEDVIHSLFIPAFRIKQDVLPDRYTVTWFKATRPGTYHLLCTQYCGTNHSEMRGSVVVMEPAEYQRWLAEGNTSLSLARQGELLFQQYGCSGCHQPPPGMARQGPLLNGLFGRPVPLTDGSTIMADLQYLRDSILLPSKDIVAGFQPVMPTFKGVLSNDQVNAIIEYIKSLGSMGAPVEAEK